LLDLPRQDSQHFFKDHKRSRQHRHKDNINSKQGHKEQASLTMVSCMRCAGPDHTWHE